VERDEDVAIELGDGTRYAATIVGRDPDTDLAVLRVDAIGLPAISRAQAGEVKVGHIALALGRPGNGGLQATIGIIGSRIESQTGGQEGYILHTDAVLYPGFSGGPLVDTSGRIVGLNNLIFGRGKGVAIGTPILNHVAGALLTHGSIQRGYLGIRTQSVTVPASLALGQEGGALIVQVEPGSPADQGGLVLGDAVLGVDGIAVSDVDDLRQLLRTRQAGDKVTLRILRSGSVTEIHVTLGTEDENAEPAQARRGRRARK
jgi:S1-C subfamily serine protease